MNTQRPPRTLAGDAKRVARHISEHRRPYLSALAVAAGLGLATMQVLLALQANDIARKGGADADTIDNPGPQILIEPSVCERSECGDPTGALAGSTAGFSREAAIGILVLGPDGSDIDDLDGVDYPSTLRTNALGVFSWSIWWQPELPAGVYTVHATDLETNRSATATFAFVDADGRRIALTRGEPGPVGFWYTVQLVGFEPGSSVIATCHDSVDPQGFWSQTFSIDANGGASDSTLCYSADGPDHWVTLDGIESERVEW